MHSLNDFERQTGIHSFIHSFIYSFIHSNVESEVLEAVAMVSYWVFKLRLKLSSEGDCLTGSGMSFQILGAQ